MKNIAIVTTSRADFFLLKPLIVRMMNDEFVNPSLVVTGSHISEDFGLTYKQILDEQIPIAHKIPMLKKLNGPHSISNSIAKGLIGFANLFSKNRFDLVVLLGDRYELFSIAIAALNENIPIAHIHGGELTYGAIDEYVRHAITKMSVIHFTATEIYRNRVIQLGENPKRVFNVGSLGVENILGQKIYPKVVLTQVFNFDFSKPYALVTFHPETRANENSLNQFKILWSALSEVEALNYVITYSNHDNEGNLINGYLEQNPAKNTLIVKSLGKYYSSVMKFSEMIIGNSSSGIIEAPSLQVPTLNIGSRQEGRIRADSVFDSQINVEDIVSKIEYIMKSKNIYNHDIFYNPYHKKNTSKKILKIIKDINIENSNLKKEFYDILP